MAPHFTPAPERRSQETWPNGEPLSVRGSTKSYHYIMTVASIEDGQLISGAGVLDVCPGDTRWDVFNHVYASITFGGEPGDRAVLFFSLEPDELLV